MGALIKIEGFDWIDEVPIVYTIYSGTPTTVGASETRYNSGRALSLADQNTMIKIPTQTSDSGAMGFAFKCTSIGTSSSDIILLHGGSDNGGAALALRLNTDGTLSIRDGVPSSIITSTNAMISNQWYYVEWLFELTNSTNEPGYVRVDGQNWITVTTTTDTRAAADDGISSMVFKGHIDGTTYYDDIYASSHQSGLLGDMQIIALSPTGDGALNTWDGNDGNDVDNYQRVDETGDPDEDLTYVYTTGDENLEMYRFSDLPVTANKIFGIELITRAKRSGVGEMVVAQDFLTDSTTTEPTDGRTQLGTTFNWTRTLLEENPDTSSLFSEAEVNNLHFGSKSYTGNIANI